MRSALQRFYPAGRSHILLSIVGGLTCATIVTVMLASLDGTNWVVLMLAGLLLCLPALILKDSRHYWLTLFLVSLPFEISKNLFKGAVDPQWIYENLGMPPWGALSIKLYPSDLPLLALLILWALDLATKKKVVYFPKIATVMLVTLGWVTVISLFAKYPLLSVPELLRQYRYFVVFLYIVNNVTSRNSLRVLIAGLMFTLFMEGFVTVLLHQLKISSLGFEDFFGVGGTKSATDLPVFDTGDSGGSPRGVGTFGHPSGAAMYLVILLPLSIAFFLIAKTKAYRWFYGVTAAFGIAGLLLTFSRSALVAFLGGVGVFLVIAFYRGLIRGGMRPLVLLLCLGCVLASPVVYYQMTTYMTTRPEAYRYRFFLMETGWNMFKSNPILGVGLANSTAVKREYLKERRFADDEKLAIHNNHLVILVETGLLGFLLVFGIASRLCIDVLRLSKSADDYIAAISVSILSAYAALFIYALGDNVAGNAHNILVWIFAALIVSLRNADLGQMTSPFRLAPTATKSNVRAPNSA